MKFWLSLVGYQLVWFSAVIGAGARTAPGRGSSRLLVYAACQLAAARRYKTDLSLMAMAIVMGLLFDSGLIRAGLVSYAAAWPLCGDGSGLDSCAMGCLFADLYAILGLSANASLAGGIAGSRRRSAGLSGAQPAAGTW